MSDAVVLKSQAGLLQKARLTNETSNGYRSFVTAQITRPTTTDAGTATGQVAFPLTYDAGGMMGPGVWVYPYAVGANNNTFSMRVLGWQLNAMTGTFAGPQTWFPVTLIEVACTISSTAIGVASGYVLNTELFADTITITGTTNNQGVSCNVISPANDTMAGRFWLSLEGSIMLDFLFTTGGSATSCNCLWKIGHP